MGRRKREEPTKNIVVVSDLHCGCQVGLCPGDGVRLDNDGWYTPSAMQQVVWEWWQEFWGPWLKSKIHDEPFDLVVNGDALDGVHHGSTTQISHNLSIQQDVALDVLTPVVQRARRYYHIRGTEAHVGKSAQDEEKLAKSLGAVPNSAGQHARYELWKLLGDNNVLIHFTHHIGTTGSQAYESTAVMRELVEAYAEAGRWDNRAPDVVVRSHRHRCIQVEIPTNNTSGISVVTPGWQLKTPFVFKIPGGRQSQPQIGGLLIREAPDGVWYVTKFVRSLERPEPE